MKRWLLLAVFVLIIGLPVTAYNSGVAPSIMGHTVDEIDGLEELILSLIPDPEPGGGGGIVCNPTPLYSSMDEGNGVSYRYRSHKYNNGTRDVPSSCRQPAGCIIKQDIYNSAGLYKTRQFDYRQEFPTNKWWSAYRTSGGYVNGDNTKTTIIPRFSYLYLFDDYSYGSVTSEHLADKWLFADLTTSYGMRVYICDIGSEDVDPDADPEP